MQRTKVTNPRLNHDHDDTGENTSVYILTRYPRYVVCYFVTIRTEKYTGNESKKKKGA
jgi:hypothetical protein